MELSLRARVRSGDPDAFGQLFDSYAQAVYRLAVQLTGDWSAAEDAVSLTFLEAWRLRERVDPDGGSLRPWLLGITVNVVRNASRAARRHHAAVGRLPPASAVPDFADDLADRMDDAARVAQVRVLLGTFRQNEREVIALCVWSGLDYEQAARALGVPVGTVRSRLSRARARLRELAADREPGPDGGQVKGGREHAARLMWEGTDGRPA